MSDFEGFMAGFVVGIMILGTLIIFTSPEIKINQEVGDEICYKLTYIEGVRADSEDGKLICETPETNQNIIIKGGEDEKQ